MKAFRSNEYENSGKVLKYFRACLHEGRVTLVEGLP